jgi:deoxyribodipyrimidine photo-lyase
MSSSSKAIVSRAPVPRVLGGVEQARVRTLNAHELPAAPASGTDPPPFVLYWMQNSVRTRHSPALEHAAGLARSLGVALRAVHTFDVVAPDARPLPERHAAFLLEALSDTQATLCVERNVSLAVVAPGSPPEVAIPALVGAAAIAVVTDTSYLRRGIADRLRVAAALKVPLIAVEGDIVVPVEVASSKVEHAARTLRPKLNRLIPDYLIPLSPVLLDPATNPPLDPTTRSSSGTGAWLASAGLSTLDVRDVGVALAALPGLDRGAPRVPSEIFRGGETLAQKTLSSFLISCIRRYASGRNEPALSLQSGLSPHLRVGAISPVDIALQTHAHLASLSSGAPSSRSGTADGVASFLEELIVRRELSANMCWFNRDGYDVWNDVVPEYARESLAAHRNDPRPVTYTYEQLEAAITHDPYWNAAQRELIVTGKMHGYMRMYWAKQIIGWVPDPEVALDYALLLNNRWELDAVDPNSYAGIMWCFGKHDQGWKERPIWGKVRYMKVMGGGLTTKFNMAAYLAKVDRLVAEHGYPPHIDELQESAPKRAGVQKSITEAFGVVASANAPFRAGKSSSGAPSAKRQRKKA